MSFHARQQTLSTCMPHTWYASVGDLAGGPPRQSFAWAVSHAHGSVWHLPPSQGTSQGSPEGPARPEQLHVHRRPQKRVGMPGAEGRGAAQVSRPTCIFPILCCTVTCTFSILCCTVTCTCIRWSHMSCAVPVAASRNQELPLQVSRLFFGRQTEASGSFQRRRPLDPRHGQGYNELRAAHSVTWPVRSGCSR
jgi:hypothetical protein